VSLEFFHCLKYSTVAVRSRGGGGFCFLAGPFAFFAASLAVCLVLRGDLALESDEVVGVDVDG
jgi:hypothetical protein